MIKFFRRIRQKLLSENKFSKYLLYAIGEIVLVVIGILIALQINNWNEARKARIEEKTLLTSLKSEMEYNINELNRARKVNNAIIKGTGRLVDVFSPKPCPEISETQLARLLSDALQDKPEFEPSLSVINSGQLTIISNEALKNALLFINAKVQHYRENESTVTETRWACTNQILEEGNFKQTVDIVIDTKGWYSTKGSSFENTGYSLLTSRKFENKLVLYLATSLTSEIDHFEPMHDLFHSISEMIDQELEKF